MEDNEHINEHLKRSFDGFSVQPRISSFDEILKKMERKKRRRFFFFLLPGLLILTGAISFFLPASFRSNGAKMGPKILAEAKAPITNKKSGNANPSPQTFKAEQGQSRALPPKQLRHESSKSIVSAALADTETDHVKATSKTATAGSPANIDRPSSSRSQITDSLVSDYLDLKRIFLSLNKTPADLRFSAANEKPALNEGDSAKKKKKKVQLLLGLYATPQEGSYYFSRNKNTSYNSSYMEAYLKNKKEQNDFRFFYGFGIKAGVIIKQKLEILASFGVQQFSQKETIMNIGPVPTSSGPTVNNSNSNDPRRGFVWNTQIEQTYESRYRYWDGSLELNKIHMLGKAGRIKIKTGAGFHVSRLRSTYFPIMSFDASNEYTYTSSNPSVSKLLTRLDLKAGLIEELNKVIQVQFYPVFFCSLNSMFRRDYIIKQRAYGLGLECSLLFKIRS